MVLAVLGSTQYGCAMRKDAAVPGVPTQAVSANIVRASEVVWQEGSLEIRAGIYLGDREMFVLQAFQRVPGVRNCWDSWPQGMLVSPSFLKDF